MEYVSYYTMKDKSVLVDRKGRFAVYSDPENAAKYIALRLDRMENMMKWKIEEHNYALLNSEKNVAILTKKVDSLSTDLKTVLQELKKMRQ